MALSSELGPLEALVGTWEGDDGLDVSFSHEKQAIIETPYRERTTFSPFGPVENGRQVLYGLDYRTAAWRATDVDPFHTEIGYWLWDGAAGIVMRSFMVPRGSTVLAGGPAESASREFTMKAEVGSETFGVLSNPYLTKNARCTLYSVTITIGDATYSYDETTTLEMSNLPEVVAHTDRNTLRKVG